MVLSDTIGRVVEKYQYAVYGNPRILNQNNKQLTESKYGNPYMFTGRRFDTETRLSLGSVKKMNKKIFTLRYMKRIDMLLGVGAIGVIIAIFFSEKIAEHRVQAISFFIGAGMMLWGLYIRAKKDFVYPIKIFKKKTVIKKEGKSAEIIGGIISIVGVCLSAWGLLFWIGFLRNI